MESYGFVDIDAAIKKLEKMKKENKNTVVFIVDFDNNTTKRKIANYDESCKIIRNGITIAHNQDDYISHIEVFSVKQKDKNNILPIGIMHDILIGCEQLE